MFSDISSSEQQKWQNKDELLKRSAYYPTKILDTRELCDLELLINGGFYPLKGYLDRRNYESILENCRLIDGTLWPIPITLSIAEEMLQHYTSEGFITLKDPLHNPLAILRIEDVFKPDLLTECRLVYGTCDHNHPEVSRIINRNNNYYVGGTLWKIHSPNYYDFKHLRLNPKELRVFFKNSNWQTIVGFQTRNPLHQSHLHVMLKALDKTGNQNAKLLIHPIIGPAQDGDIPYHIRVRCYEKILNYFPPGKVKLSLLPYAMRMAGPKEALLHALIRQNYGCTHFIIGRDHAGPSSLTKMGTSFYGPYEAQEFVEKFSKEMSIKIIASPEVVYSPNSKTYTTRLVGQNDDSVLTLSGTKLRSGLMKGDEIPNWLSFPEVIGELNKYYNFSRGICIYFTGISGSGKTTIATALKEILNESDHFSRKITLLDGDIIRKYISPELGFTKTDRSINVRRIGYMASLVVLNGGICLCANIAPYEEDRSANRNLISKHGRYVEVYVDTPLEVCEERDPKGLYKAARENKLKAFTGIDDPYEIPENPDITISGYGSISSSLNKIMDFLKLTNYYRTMT